MIAVSVGTWLLVLKPAARRWIDSSWLLSKLSKEEQEIRDAFTLAISLIAAVTSGDKWGYIDLEGDFANAFSEDLWKVGVKGSHVSRRIPLSLPNSALAGNGLQNSNRGWIV